MKHELPDAFVEYLAHFHGDRDYFECHEILEEYWKDHTDMARDSIWVGWIQLSVALYHHRRGNFAGAARTMDKALEKFNAEPDLERFGVQSVAFLLLVSERAAAMHSGQAYESITLPLTPALKQQVAEKCRSFGCEFGAPSDLTLVDLIHRHARRDRSDVIEERLRQLEARSGRT